MHAGECARRHRSGGHPTEPGGDRVLRFWIGVGRREVQHDAADRSHDADFEEDQAQASDLAAGQRGAVGAPMELLEHDVRRGASRNCRSLVNNSS